MLVLLLTYFYPYLFIILCNVFWITKLYGKGANISLTISILDIGLFLFNGILIASVLFAGERLSVGANLYAIFVLDLVYLSFRLALSVAGMRNIHQLLVFLVSLGLIESVIGLLQFNGLIRSINPLFKVSGSFGNPAVYANFLITILPISLLYSFSYRKETGIPFLFFRLTSLLIVFNLLAIVARASWIAAIVSIVMLAYFNNAWFKEMIAKGLLIFSRSFKKGALISLCLVVSVVMLLAYMLFIKKDSTIGRAFIFKNSIQMLKNKPLTGIGFDQFKVKYNDYQETYFIHNKEDHYYEKVASDSMVAFNEYLQIGIELGLIGILSFCGLIFVLIKRYVYNKDSEIVFNTIFICVFSILILALFSYPFRMTATLVNVILFLAILSGHDPRPVYRILLQKIPGKAVFVSMGLLGITVISYGFHYMSAVVKWQDASLRVSRGNIDSAGAEYATVYPVLMDDGLFLYDYGSYLCHNKKYYSALPVLENAGILFNYYDVYVRLGICYENTGQPSKAETAYLKACYMVPNRFYPRYKLMSFYLKNNKSDSAGYWARKIMLMEIKVPSPVINEIKKKADSTLQSIPITIN